MQLWKFIVPMEGCPDPDDPHRVWMGYVACVVAETADAARQHLTQYALERGLDPQWLKAARVVPLPIREGTIGAWAEI